MYPTARILLYTKRSSNNNNFLVIYSAALTPFDQQPLTAIVRTDDSTLLQESNLTVRQPGRAPHHVIKATASEVLAQGPFVAA